MDSSRRPKRTKISSACAACQIRKSRCELLNDQGCHRCRILGTDCSLRVPIVDGYTLPGRGEDLQNRSLSGRSRSPFVTAHGHDNLDDDSHGLGNEQKQERVERDEDDLMAWKGRVSLLEQRLRIIEARLEASASIPGTATRRRTQHLVDPLESPSHFRSARTISTNDPSTADKDIQHIGDSRHQLERSSTRTQREKASEPSGQHYSSSMVVLIKWSAPYVGAQEILRCARNEGSENQFAGLGMVRSWTRDGWADPLASGMVTEGQMQASWLCFSTAFINVLPLPSLTPTNRSDPLLVPSHPFLKLAILVYVSLIRTTNPLTLVQCCDIREMLFTSLQNVWTVAPSLPIIRALIILALVPAFTLIASPDEEQDGRAESHGYHGEDDMDESRNLNNMGWTNNLASRPLPSPVHLLQLAKNMALALGLARANTETIGIKSDGEGLDSCTGAAGLEGFLLWHCILQQEYWAGVIMSPHLPRSLSTQSDDLAKLDALLQDDRTKASPSPLLSSGEHKSHAHTKKTNLALAQYVSYTSKLQRILEPPLAFIESIEQCPTVDEFARAYESFKMFVEGMESWYSQFPRDSFVGARYLYITAKQYDYAVHLRIATWIQLLPRPLISELLHTLLQQCGRSLIRCGMHLIVSLTSYRDLQPFMPGGNHVASICAWAGLIHIQAMFKGHANAEWTGRKHASHLVTFEETMRKLHPGHAGTLIDVLKDSIKHVRPRHENKPPRPDPDLINATLHNDPIPPGPSAATWNFPATNSGSNTASRGMASSSLQMHNSVSNLRHQQYPPSPTLPPFGIGPQDSLGSIDGYETNHPVASTSCAPALSGFPEMDNNAPFFESSVSTTQAVSGAQMMPFLGEFTTAEMQAFETWWFEMLNVDGTPEGAGAMLG